MALKFLASGNLSRLSHRGSYNHYFLESLAAFTSKVEVPMGASDL